MKRNLIILPFLLGFLVACGGENITSDAISSNTSVEVASKFYDEKIVNLETLETKIDATKDDTKKTLIVIYIREENETCASCLAAEKPLENFFYSDHSKYENARDYEIVVLDIASDEFMGEDSKDELIDIRDHIEKYDLQFVFEDTKRTNPDWLSNGIIDVTKDDPISTPCIARYEDGACVGIRMGYASSDKKEFEKFCYYDPETDFKEEY